MSTEPSSSLDPGPSTSASGSPSRSRAHSLSLRFKSKIPLHPIDADHLSPTSASSQTSVRRVMSYEDARRANTTQHPPLPPPKDGAGLPHDPLLKAARVKLSSQDQEAMRKLRSTMVDISDSGSSRSPSTSTSPNSSMFPATSVAGPSREVRSRRSTLSKLVVPDENQLDAAIPLSSSKPEISLNFTLAVIGEPKTGRTTLINRAFKPYGVTNPVSRTLSSGDIVQTYESTVISGAKSRMRSSCHIIEMDISSLDLDDSGSGDEILSQVNGILLCYDSSRRDTFASVEPHLPRLALMGLPVVVFACRSDASSSRAVDPSYANSVGEPYNVGLIEVTDLTSDGRSKMRNGVRYLVSRLEQRHLRKQRKASRDASPSSSNPTVISPDSDGSVTGDKIMWHAGFDMISTKAPNRDSMTSEKRSSGGSLHWIMQGPFSEKRRSTEQNGGSQSIVLEPAEPSSTAKVTSSSDVPIYVALDDLFNQLFSKIVSTEDEAFVKSFFLTYRRFCSPREVIAQFLDRLKQIEGYKVSRDVKHWALQKLTGALIDWTSRYPGDLCDVVTRNIFRQVLGLLLGHLFMAHLTADLAAIEENLDDVVDVDASWSHRTSGGNATVASVPSTAQTELLIDGEVLYDFESTLVRSDTDTPPVKESTPSLRTASTTSIAVEDVQAQRKGSNPILVSGSDEFKLYRLPEDLNKWAAPLRYVLMADPRAFAMDLTRVQWKLFVAIRPRDVFRHDFGKERDGPVGKAIDFFNHLSRWVSTIILADPKPKHRARAYEAFMLIAHQLRRLNNYDSLYALLSGMNETSIHRLTQTHALVQPNPDVAKDFQSHNKLMDPRGGYTHYRRALSADVSHGRPAIPLVTTILAMVNRLQSIRSDDIRPDGMVQWEKFARFGEILSIIPECQAKGPPVTGQPSSSFLSMLNDVPIIADEDGLFERSRMLEPAGSGGAQTTQMNVLKKFGKLAF